MREENEAIFCRWIDEVWNKGIEKTVDELFAENAVANYQHRSEKKPIHGNEEYKKFIRFVHNVFADLRVSVEQIASDKNKVTALCIVTARCRNSEPNSSPVQKTVKLSGLCQIIFESGKIMQVWSNIDFWGAHEIKEAKTSVNGG